MAQGTTVVLLPYNAEIVNLPGNTVLNYAGVRREAAAYYLANRDLQTISWAVNREFSGIIRIEASIITDPTESDWYTVYTLPLLPPNNNTGQYGYHNLVGNYVWIRGRVTDWTAGIIELVSASY